MKAKFVFKGGSGSGNYGHSGRPGKIGGSSAGAALRGRAVNENILNPSKPSPAAGAEQAAAVRAAAYRDSGGAVGISIRNIRRKMNASDGEDYGRAVFDSVDILTDAPHKFAALEGIKASMQGVKGVERDGKQDVYDLVKLAVMPNGTAFTDSRQYLYDELTA